MKSFKHFRHNRRNASGTGSESFTPQVNSWRDWPIWVKGVIAFGIVLRFVFLQWKSPHFDEGINGHFVIRMWNEGSYPYDPTNFHGPLYFYLLQIGELLFGRGILAFRLVTALLSSMVVIMSASFARYFGRAAYWAAAIVAISPAMVFYGRYAIHESLFILSQMVFAYGFVQWRLEGGKRSVYLMLLGTMAAMATKETFFIFTGTWFIAWAMVKAAEKIPSLKTEDSWFLKKRPPVGGSIVWITASVVSVAILILLFTGWTSRPEGYRDMIRAFAVWTKTGTGATGHEKPIFYWIMLMARYEWPTLLALVVTPIFCFYASAWARFFTLVGFGLWLAYTIIPYKTPWCIIGVIWPLALASGFFLEHRVARKKAAIAISVIASVAALFTTLRLNFRDYELNSEPYVYVQTTQDVNRVTRLLEARVALHPEDRNMKIQCLNRDSWPFPWLLSLYTDASYSQMNDSIEVNGDVILGDGPNEQQIVSKLKRRYLRRPLKIRDSYEDGFALFDYERFRALMPPESPAVGPAQASAAEDAGGQQ